MDPFFDSLATVVQIPSFILLFFLVLLFILNNCAYFELIILSLLKSNLPNWNMISTGDTLDCWHFLWDERRNYKNAVFLHRGSHNPLPHTSLPLGSCWTTQDCFQPDFQRLNVWLFGIYHLCALALLTVWNNWVSLSVLFALISCITTIKAKPRVLRCCCFWFFSLPGQRLE